MLSDWAKSKITGLYELHSPSGSSEEQAEQQSNADDTRFRFVFAPDAVIFHNHSKVSAEEFRKEISQTFGAVGSSVEWKECVEIPESKERPQVSTEYKHIGTMTM
jgi:hypothetical protein